MNKRKFGIIGEKIAQDYLRNQGYKILETNFYTKRGEIDIITQKDECIVFIEVKTRTNLKYGTPAMAVNSVKKKHIKHASEIFLTVNKVNEFDVRFDVIEVIIMNGKCDINHLEGVM